MVLTLFSKVTPNHPPKFVCISLTDDLTRSDMGSSGDSEKIIQHLSGELREAQEQANAEKYKCVELHGKILKNNKNIKYYNNTHCLLHIVQPTKNTVNK